MTREEEICNAIKNSSILDYNNNEYTSDDIKCAFIEGAEWADTHPKSSWISVNNKLPYDYPELIKDKYYTKKVLVVEEWHNDSTKKYIEVKDMCNILEGYPSPSYWHWRSKYYNITHWQPLPELPKI